MLAMIRERTQKGTMMRRIFVPMIILVLIQSVFFFGVVFYNNILGESEQNAYDMFESKVENKRRELNNRMVSQWSNLDGDAQEIERHVKILADEGRIDPDNLVLHSDDSRVLLDDISEYIISILRNHRVTGTYFFLCDGITADEGEQRFPGIYLSDSNVENDNHLSNSDLLVRRGSKSLVEKLGIATDAMWQPNFVLKDDNLKFFYDIYQNYEKCWNETENRADLGCWIPNFERDNDNTMSYVVPVTYDDRLVGFLGIAVTYDHIKNQLNYDELDDDGKGAYGIVFSDDDKYYNVVTDNPYFSVRYEPGVEFDIKVNGDEATMARDGKTVIVSMGELNLYNDNTPFADQKWYVCGLIEENELYAFTTQIRNILIFSITFTILLGLILSIALSIFISKPVVDLAKDIRNMTFKDKLSIRKTHIIEVDQLVDAIEKTSNKAIEAVARLDRIIRLSNAKLEGFEIDYNANEIYVTSGFFDVFGMDVDVSNLNIESFEKLLARFDDKRRRNNSKIGQEYIYKLDNGVCLNLRRVKDSHGKAYGLVEDITEIIRQRQLVEHERDHDVLTGLMNRRAYMTRIKRLFTLEANVIKVGALVMCDMDNLKAINDEYGHEYGDMYIQKMAEALRWLLPDEALIARISGDEFIIFVYGYETKEDLKEMLERVWEGFANFTVMMADRQHMAVSASAGVAWLPDDSHDFKILQKFADFAMHSAKEGRKGTLCDFSLEEYRGDIHNLKRKMEFNSIMNNKALSYHFQPIVSAKDGSIHGYEALMRPVSNLLTKPTEILELAKMEGKLYMVEQLTMEKGIEAYADLLKLYEPGTDIKLFINSIANQKLGRDVIELFESKYGDLLASLVIELTENEELNQEYTEEKFLMISKWKAKLALDDYGSGYNSGRNLLYLNPDYVKIDMDIIRDIDKEPDKVTIVRSTVEYCHEREKFVIAEGVETHSELKTVIGLGVDFIQGYIVAKPMPTKANISEEVIAEIKKYNK